MKLSFYWKFVALSFLFLLITNRWLVNEPDMSIYRFDSISYLEIARAAPALPGKIDISPGYPEMQGKDTLVLMPYHHAQRFVGPYLVGLVAHIIAVKEEYVFAFIAPILILLTALLLVDAASFAYKIDDKTKSFLFALYIFNPYVSRFYLAVPTYLGDLLFLLGFSVVLFSLIKEKVLLLLMGLFVAALGRQTALLILPGVCLWVLTIFPSKLNRSKKLLVCIAAAVVILIYLITGKIATNVGELNINDEHMKGIVAWVNNYLIHQEAVPTNGVPLVPVGLTNSNSALKDFIAFLVRGISGIVILIAITLALALACGKRIFLSKKAQIIFLIFFCIISQPFLAGPAISGATIIRLVAISAPALILLIISLGLEKFSFNNVKFGGLVALLVFSSFHHRYTLLHLDIGWAPAFAAITYIAASGIFLIFLREKRGFHSESKIVL